MVVLHDLAIAKTLLSRLKFSCLSHCSARLKVKIVRWCSTEIKMFRFTTQGSKYRYQCRDIDRSTDETIKELVNKVYERLWGSNEKEESSSCTSTPTKQDNSNNCKDEGIKNTSNVFR